MHAHANFILIILNIILFKKQKNTCIIKINYNLNRNNFFKWNLIKEFYTS